MKQRRIWLTDSGSVCLRDGDRIREFWVPYQGGYVREVDELHPGTLARQVCRCLDHRGDTLTSTREHLLDLIRREYARARRRDEREESRWN